MGMDALRLCTGQKPRTHQPEHILNWLSFMAAATKHMKTLKATGPQVFGVETDRRPGVPAGKIHIFTVRYETYEMDRADFDRTQFEIHDANTPEAQLLAESMK